MKSKWDEITLKAFVLLAVFIIWATSVNFTQRDLRNKPIKTRIMLYLLDLLYAGFLGLIGFILAYDMLNVSIYGASAIGGIMAHKGANFLYLIEVELIKKVKTRL